MLKRMLSLIMMILLVIPAAYATGAAANGEDLLSALDAANSTEQLFERHASQYRHECIYSRGELLMEFDRYYDAFNYHFVESGILSDFPKLKNSDQKDSGEFDEMLMCYGYNLTVKGTDKVVPDKAYGILLQRSPGHCMLTVGGIGEIPAAL